MSLSFQEIRKPQSEEVREPGSATGCPYLAQTTEQPSYASKSSSTSETPKVGSRCECFVVQSPPFLSLVISASCHLLLRRNPLVDVSGCHPRPALVSFLVSFIAPFLVPS